MACQFNVRIPCKQKTGCSVCTVFLGASRIVLEKPLENKK